MKTNYRTLFLIADNLASLYEDGIPIVLSLELLRELPISKEYKKSLLNIKENIMKGNSLGSSFYEDEKLYPSFFSGIIEIGENSGELVSVLRSLKDFYFNVDKVNRKLKSALRYPMFILAALISLIFVFLIFIIPNLYETFNVMDKEKSKIISFFYEFYNYLKTNKIYSITFIMSCIIALILILKYIKSTHRDKENNLLLKIKFLQQYYEYIFIMILSIILGSGIQISKGLDLCIESIDIQCIKISMEELKDEILVGNEIGASLNNSRFLSKYSLSMISMGEKSGELTEVLQKASKRLESNLLEKLEKVISYVTPVSIIVVAFVVIVFIFIFIMPMFNMIYSGVL